MDRWAKAYQAEVGAELKKYGLRADDMLDPDMHPVRPCFVASAALHLRPVPLARRMLCPSR